MAKNGISTLATKADRQIAKLELAQTKRQQVGTQGYRDLRYYDANLLPARYQENDTVLTPHPDGLQPGRPWKTTPNILSGLWQSTYNGYFGGNELNFNETDVQWFDTQTPLATAQAPNFDYLAMGASVSVQWLGYFQAPHTANYTFDATGTDDELYFWIGNKAVTNYTAANADVYTHANSPSGRQVSDPIALIANQYYPIRMQWGNSSGNGGTVFAWSDDYTPLGP